MKIYINSLQQNYILYINRNRNSSFRAQVI